MLWPMFFQGADVFSSFSTLPDALCALDCEHTVRLHPPQIVGVQRESEHEARERERERDVVCTMGKGLRVASGGHEC